MKRSMALISVVVCGLWVAGCEKSSPTGPAGGKDDQSREGALVIPPGSQPPVIPCIAVYAPVCAEGFKTYSNACLAKADNAKVLFQGVCPRIGRAPKVLGR